MQIKSWISKQISFFFSLALYFHALQSSYIANNTREKPRYRIFLPLYTKLKHLLQQSVAHKINVEILKEKYKNIPVLLQQLRKSMVKYSSYKNLRNLLLQLLSCKISYKIHLKNLKHLPPHSLACEVYRKQMK